MKKKNWIFAYALAERAAQLLAHPENPDAPWEKARDLREAIATRLSQDEIERAEDLASDIFQQFAEHNMTQ